MARGRGKLSPKDQEYMVIISQNINRLLSENNVTQARLSRGTGIPASTLTGYVKGTSLPIVGNIQKIADYFSIEKADIDPRFSTKPPKPSPAPQSPTDELTEQILETVRDLSQEGKQSVLSYAREVLEREEDEAALAEPELFKIYFTSAAKAGPTGFSYDDYDNDKYAYTDEEPPRYDIATMVDGWSMAPDYDDGDILYLRDYGTSHYNGQECVVVVDDKNYFKKIYTTDEGLLLVSINEDKDEFPNFTVPFPPNEDTHIKIFEVVGSFTPVEG